MRMRETNVLSDSSKAIYNGHVLPKDLSNEVYLRGEFIRTPAYREQYDLTHVDITAKAS